MHSLCPCVGVARDRPMPEAFSAKPCGDSPAPGEEPTGTGPACSEPGDELGWNRARAFLSGASGVVAITRFTPQHPFQPGSARARSPLCPLPPAPVQSWGSKCNTRSRRDRRCPRTQERGCGGGLAPRGS